MSSRRSDGRSFSATPDCIAAVFPAKATLRAHIAALFSEAIHRNFRYVDAFAMLGDICLHQRDCDTSERALQHALKLDLSHYHADLRLMTLHETTKDPHAQVQA